MADLLVSNVSIDPSVEVMRGINPDNPRGIYPDNPRGLNPDNPQMRERALNCAKSRIIVVM